MAVTKEQFEPGKRVSVSISVNQRNKTATVRAVINGNKYVKVLSNSEYGFKGTLDWNEIADEDILPILEGADDAAMNHLMLAID